MCSAFLSSDVSAAAVVRQVPAKKGESTRLPDPLMEGAESKTYDDPSPRWAETHALFRLVNSDDG